MEVYRDETKPEGNVYLGAHAIAMSLQNYRETMEKTPCAFLFQRVPPNNETTRALCELLNSHIPGEYRISRTDSGAVPHRRKPYFYGSFLISHDVIVEAWMRAFDHFSKQIYPPFKFRQIFKNTPLAVRYAILAVGHVNGALENVICMLRFLWPDWMPSISQTWPAYYVGMDVRALSMLEFANAPTNFAAILSKDCFVYLMFSTIMCIQYSEITKPHAVPTSVLENFVSALTSRMQMQTENHVQVEESVTMYRNQLIALQAIFGIKSFEPVVFDFLTSDFFTFIKQEISTVKRKISAKVALNEEDLPRFVVHLLQVLVHTTETSMVHQLKREKYPKNRHHGIVKCTQHLTVYPVIIDLLHSEQLASIWQVLQVAESASYTGLEIRAFDYDDFFRVSQTISGILDVEHNSRNEMYACARSNDCTWLVLTPESWRTVFAYQRFTVYTTPVIPSFARMPYCDAFDLCTSLLSDSGIALWSTVNICVNFISSNISIPLDIFESQKPHDVKYVMHYRTIFHILASVFETPLQMLEEFALSMNGLDIVQECVFKDNRVHSLNPIPKLRFDHSSKSMVTMPPMIYPLLALMMPHQALYVSWCPLVRLDRTLSKEKFYSFNYAMEGVEDQEKDRYKALRAWLKTPMLTRDNAPLKETVEVPTEHKEMMFQLLCDPMLPHDVRKDVFCGMHCNREILFPRHYSKLLTSITCVADWLKIINGNEFIAQNQKTLHPSLHRLRREPVPSVNVFRSQPLHVRSAPILDSRGVSFLFALVAMLSQDRFDELPTHDQLIVPPSIRTGASDVRWSLNRKSKLRMRSYNVAATDTYAKNTLRMLLNGKCQGSMLFSGKTGYHFGYTCFALVDHSVRQWSDRESHHYSYVPDIRLLELCLAKRYLPIVRNRRAPFSIDFKELEKRLEEMREAEHKYM